MYLDTGYIAKIYLQEPDSIEVRSLVLKSTETICCSLLGMSEFHCVLHRQSRESRITQAHAALLAQKFSEHCDAGLWKFIPLAEPLLRRMNARVLGLPPNVFLRAADAIHLVTAADLGETEIWTGDRHMLAAAPHFGLTGRSVAA